MPRVTKDTEKDILPTEKKNTRATKKTASATTKKKTTATKKTATTASKKSTTKTTTTKKKETSKKKTETKLTAKEPKKSSTNKVTKTTEAKAKKTTTKKATSTKKKTNTPKAKKLEKNVVAEYYDLPYRYNETLVKILYQTPTILFVYWDISDADRENMKKQYGEHVFENTKPILRIFNITKQYQFEVEINDFANSWYIHVEDANCEYKVELDRRVIHYEENIHTDYIYVSTSNYIESPNDHILLDEFPEYLRFKNVKNNQVTMKHITTFHLVGIHKIYNIHEFYKRFYQEDVWEEINNRKILNPSSMPSS